MRVRGIFAFQILIFFADIFLYFFYGSDLLEVKKYSPAKFRSRKARNFAGVQEVWGQYAPSAAKATAQLPRTSKRAFF